MGKRRQQRHGIRAARYRHSQQRRLVYILQSALLQSEKHLFFKRQ
jgi:hypothetical protein